jgi:hypothetical protein
MHANHESDTQPAAIPSQDAQSSSFVIAAAMLMTPVMVVIILALLGKFSAVKSYSAQENFARAVRQTQQPQFAFRPQKLASVKTDPVTLVTWTREEYVPGFKNGTAAKDSDIWVTKVPELENFCREYVKAHGPDPIQLSRRLEQRLGLRPLSGKNEFVEFTVSSRDGSLSRLFRPCADPSISTEKCDPEPGRNPGQIRDDLATSDPHQLEALKMRYRLLNTYYQSYATRDQFPWTYLGYTFDWAQKEDSEDLMTFGESEFIVPAGTGISFLSATDTATYCKP